MGRGGGRRKNMREAMDDFFSERVESGLDRAAEYGLELPDREEVEESFWLLRDVIENHPDRASWSEDRFVGPFVESATLAIVARVRYEPENPLSDEDMRAYLEHTAWVFNSFSHKHAEE
jgi:hypothetical protein